MYGAATTCSDAATGRELGQFAAAKWVESLSTGARHSMSVCQTASAARPYSRPATQPSVDNRQ